MSIKVGFEYLTKDSMFTKGDFQDKVNEIHKMIEEGTGAGSDFLGWLHYPSNYDKAEFERIKAKASEFIKNYEVLVVVGIGGSYLGAKASIEALNGLFKKNGLEVIYLGNTLDPNYIHDAINYIKDKKFCICVISKSGTTTEPSVSFRILKTMAEEKYGKEGAKNAIVAVTDKEKGALKKLSTKEGYETYVLPGNIGGRFSVLTAVGLFPMACAGIDIDEFMAGFQDGEKEYSDPDLEKNNAYRYAVERHNLYNLGYNVEMVGSYEPRLTYVNSWLQQLFDESEGKDGKSLFVTGCTFTTDLHSLGQYIQEGKKILFETIINVKNPNYDIEVPYDEENLDGLNYLAGKKLSYINHKAYEGTLDAHSRTGNVPNITITIDKVDARNLGHLYYFFMKACAMSAYLNGVNPFNQPGVEVYKKNMFHLLGKEGY